MGVKLLKGIRRSPRSGGASRKGPVPVAIDSECRSPCRTYGLDQSCQWSPFTRENSETFEVTSVS